MTSALRRLGFAHRLLPGRLCRQSRHQKVQDPIVDKWASVAASVHLNNAMARCTRPTTSTISSPPEDEGAFLRFCDTWNDTLSRRPLPVAIFFGFTGTLTWLGMFLLISASPARHVLAEPAFAVGFLVMRATKRFRMPLNIALTMPLVSAFPTLSRLKVSPLMKIFVVDQDNKAKMKEWWEETQQTRFKQRTRTVIQAVQDRFTRAVKWLEGPVDKFGAPLFMTSKCTSVATICVATIAASNGLDVPSYMSKFGLSEDLQENGGLFAAAAALNVLCMPVHFFGAVHSVQVLELMASRMYRENFEEMEAMRRAHAARVAKAAGRASTSSDSSEPQSDKQTAEQVEKEEPKDEIEEELTEEKVKSHLVMNVALLTVLVDLVLHFIVLRTILGEKVISDKPKVAATAQDDGCTALQERVSTTGSQGLLEGSGDLQAADASQGELPNIGIK